MIKGVTNEPISSFGTVLLDIYLPNYTITHKFHIVPNTFNIPSDGIIGKEFNKKFKSKIDYLDMTFTIRVANNEIVIPINFEPQENTIVLPARSESFRVFHISNFTEKSVILNREISDGIFIPTTIIDSKDPVIRVLNTNDKPILIKNVIDISGKLSEFDIFKIEKTEKCDRKM